MPRPTSGLPAASVCVGPAHIQDRARSPFAPDRDPRGRLGLEGELPPERSPAYGLRFVRHYVRFGLQAKYTGTPSRTMISPGHVVALWYTKRITRMVAAPAM